MIIVIDDGKRLGSVGNFGVGGWTPVPALVADGDRIVQQVSDWVGGTGTKPVAGQYVGASGLVDDIADAVNLKGDTGAGLPGIDGWTPLTAIVEDGARRVHRVVDWFGGKGQKPDVGMYIGPNGFVALPGQATDIRGPSAVDTPEFLRDKLEELDADDRLPVDSVKDAAKIILAAVTNAPAIVDPAGRPIIRSSAIRRNIAGFKPWGTSGNMGTAGMMMIAAEGLMPFKAVQLIVFGQNTEGITGAIAVSSILGNGYVPRGADGVTAVAPAPITWNLADPNDLSNLGGGRGYGTIKDAIGAFTYPASTINPYHQGCAVSDWIWNDSLGRVDAPSEGPIVMARWTAPFNNTGADTTVNIGGDVLTIKPGNATPGHRRREVSENLEDRERFIRNLRMTYSTNPQDILLPSPGGMAGLIGGNIPANNQHYANFMLRFLYDVPAMTFMLFADSHGAGYVRADAVPLPPWGANGLGGWVSKLRGSLVAAGLPVMYSQQAMSTDLSINFHQRADWAIRNRMATHYFIQMRSINDNTDQSAAGMARRLTAALARTNELVSKAYASGGQPIVIQPWTSSPTDEAKVRVAAESLRAQGVSVVDIPAILCLPNRVTLKPEYTLTNDLSHYPESAHDAIELEVRFGGYIK